MAMQAVQKRMGQMKSGDLVALTAVIAVAIYTLIFLPGCSAHSPRLCEKKCVLSGGKIYRCPARCDAVGNDYRKL